MYKDFERLKSFTVVKFFGTTFLKIIEVPNFRVYYIDWVRLGDLTEVFLSLMNLRFFYEVKFFLM